MSERLIVVSTDCHAGLPIADYKPYVESKYHEMMEMAVPITVEMMEQAESTFLIKEINDAWRAPIKKELTGAWDYKERLKMLAGDGIAAEVIFPDGITEKNTPPFGAGLGLSPRALVPALQWAGAMAQSGAPTIPRAILVWRPFPCCGMWRRRWKRCADALITALPR